MYLRRTYTGKRALQNLYELKVENETVKGQLACNLRKRSIVLPTRTTRTPPADRFKLAAKIRSRHVEAVRGQVWDLFKDREALTNEMNSLIEKSINAAM